jgi:hypothetical protein
MSQSRAAKPTTLTFQWTGFSSSGFTRTDAPLGATLHSPRKSNFVFAGAASRYHPQALPPFGWDTEPVIGAEVIIEDAFMDVFCDLMYGGGWMETEREEVNRECNWALVSGIALKMRDHRLTCFTLAD